MKINEIINKFLLAGGKFIPEFHLWQPVFIYSPCRQFTKHRERVQKFKETGDLKYICENELDKACFAHDTAYSDRNDLAKKTVSDKVLKERAYEVAINSKYDEYQRELANMVYTFFN